MYIVKNKEGFTLVELLVVLIVLSVISAICYPIVTKTINNQKVKLTAEQQNRIIDAAKNYVASNNIGDEDCLTIPELQSSGYLEAGTIENPSGGTMDGSVSVKWDDSSNQYIYKYVGSC